jgi:hypothetical protein
MAHREYGKVGVMLLGAARGELAIGPIAGAGRAREAAQPAAGDSGNE